MQNRLGDKALSWLLWLGVMSWCLSRIKRYFAASAHDFMSSKATESHGIDNANFALLA
ncbi:MULTISPECIES: hypothetical protein [unclassified Pseudoalteromonas]|uniref:hypothetical protein n=1 Tax=unclassified Pseudoalteromonas TaxID=194690 RepID=UPI00301473D0